MPKHRPPGRLPRQAPQLGRAHRLPEPNRAPQAGSDADSETSERSASSARIAWFATLGARTERDRPSRPISLPPPNHVRALRGRGQVTIEWPPVAGAAGYLVHRGPAADGPFAPIDQGGGRAPMDE